MANWNIKLIALGIIIITSIIFYFQNNSPIIPLTIVGFETIALPVALWLILSAIAGLIISILLQWLFKLAKPTTPSSGNPKGPKNPEPDPAFQFPEQEDTQPGYQYSTESNQTIPGNSNQQGNNPSQQASQDWDVPLGSEDWDEVDDWNIEQPPPRNSDPIYEVPQTPEQTTQQGSMYSYRYRETRSRVDPIHNEPEEPEPEPTENDLKSNPENVYDANYRVIRPPLWNLPDDDEDDEFQDEPQR